MSDSEPGSLSPVDFENCGAELRTSSGSDIESEVEERRSRLTMPQVMAEAFSSKATARKKRPIIQSKHKDARKRVKEGFSTPSRSDGSSRAIDSPSNLVGTEVKSALKEITSLLNTVVKRVERVENELQRQRSSCSSSSNEKTPTRAKPTLAVKVSHLSYTCNIHVLCVTYCFFFYRLK